MHWGIGGADEQMKSRLVAVLAFSAVLAGCSPKLRWHDTTGLGRSEVEEDRAAHYCEAQNIPPGYLQLSPAQRPAWEPIWADIKACMADLGWVPILPQNSN